MIPKIIHYCWFGRRKKPNEVLKMINSWKKVLPEYEIKEWNESNFNIENYPYSKEAYLSGNFAFVSDVCRLEVLYKYGGIYLDTDVEVLKTFTPFLSEESFLGYEVEETEWIGLGIIGAQPEEEWINYFLDYYRNNHFINFSGHTVRTANTKIFSLSIYPSMPKEIRPKIYPADIFCANNWHIGKYNVTKDTVTVHHLARSWRRKRQTLTGRFILILKGLLIRYCNHKEYFENLRNGIQ